MSLPWIRLSIIGKRLGHCCGFVTSVTRAGLAGLAGPLGGRAVGWRAMDRPYVLLSCAMSLDGYLDDASEQRLFLSGAADRDRVDELRAGSDAILVGAGTVRADNPRLLLRSQARREARIARAASPDPVRVVISGSGELDPEVRLFRSGQAGPLVYVSAGRVVMARERLGGVAEVVDGGE